MTYTVAQMVVNSGYLSDELIWKLACKKLHLLPVELEKIVGRNKKGSRVGLLKGKLVWEKCTRGGWVRMGAYDHDAMRGNGFVAHPGHTYLYRIVDSWTGVDIYNPRVPEVGEVYTKDMISDRQHRLGELEAEHDRLLAMRGSAEYAGLQEIFKKSISDSIARCEFHIVDISREIEFMSREVEKYATIAAL